MAPVLNVAVHSALICAILIIGVVCNKLPIQVFKSARESMEPQFLVSNKDTNVDIGMVLTFDPEFNPINHVFYRFHENSSCQACGVVFKDRDLAVVKHPEESGPHIDFKNRFVDNAVHFNCLNSPQCRKNLFFATIPKKEDVFIASKMKSITESGHDKCFNLAKEFYVALNPPSSEKAFTEKSKQYLSLILNYEKKTEHDADHCVFCYAITVMAGQMSRYLTLHDFKTILKEVKILNSKVLRDILLAQKPNILIESLDFYFNQLASDVALATAVYCERMFNLSYLLAGHVPEPIPEENRIQVSNSGFLQRKKMKREAEKKLDETTKAMTLASVEEKEIPNSQSRAIQKVEIKNSLFHKLIGIFTKNRCFEYLEKFTSRFSCRRLQELCSKKITQFNLKENFALVKQVILQDFKLYVLPFMRKLIVFLVQLGFQALDIATKNYSIVNKIVVWLENQIMKYIKKDDNNTVSVSPNVPALGH